jgi:hypothetical protein
MVSMNPFREAFVFVRLNWRIIALCALVAVIVAAATRYDRNRGRFVPLPVGDGITIVLDTRTGQFCSPWPNGFGPRISQELPRCSDLAKSWR